MRAAPSPAPVDNLGVEEDRLRCSMAVGQRQARGVSKGEGSVKKLGAAVVCAALVCVCAGAVAGKATGASATIGWSKCYAKQGPFQCGTVQVPLDYDQPNGPTISLGVIRLPASDQAHRIGSLFLNPGGPGGSGVVYTVLA